MGVSHHDLRFQVHIIAGVFSPWYHRWVFFRRGSTSEKVFPRHCSGLTFLACCCFALCLGMETGQQALVRAGDATAGILAARGSGLTMMTLSQAGGRAMASRGTIRGNVVISCLALPSPAGLQLRRQAQWNQRSRLHSRETSATLLPRTSQQGSSACWCYKATLTLGHLG